MIISKYEVEGHKCQREESDQLRMKGGGTDEGAKLSLIPIIFYIQICTLRMNLKSSLKKKVERFSGFCFNSVHYLSDCFRFIYPWERTI